MTQARKALVVMVVATLGLWGCAKGPAHHASAERIRSLEAKCSRYEEDYRAVANARDLARKRLAALEEQRDRLEKELAIQKTIARERDQLRQQLTSRITERDALQLRCDRLKKGLQNLLGQDDALAPSAPTPTGVTMATSR